MGWSGGLCHKSGFHTSLYYTFPWDTNSGDDAPPPNHPFNAAVWTRRFPLVLPGYQDPWRHPNLGRPWRVPASLYMQLQLKRIKKDWGCCSRPQGQGTKWGRAALLDLVCRKAAHILLWQEKACVCQRLLKWYWACVKTQNSDKTWMAWMICEETDFIDPKGKFSSQSSAHCAVLRIKILGFFLKATAFRFYMGLIHLILFFKIHKECWWGLLPQN